MSDSPPLRNRRPSKRLPATADTTLGRSIVPQARAHPGCSGVVPLLRGSDALAARIRLADAAERSLDVQYYIWQRDPSGALLMDALRRAAGRGVRVRLLLDDNNTSGLDGPIAALTAVPNMEVRLFNPFKLRRLRALGFVFGFARLNRRMHNKSFTADDLATIVGGRNIGDAYFDAAHDVLFVDLDVLTIGPVVDDVSRDFDRYWTCRSSYRAERVVPPLRGNARAALAAAPAGREAAAESYRQAIAASPFVEDLVAGRLAFEWSKVRLISDDPAKGLDAAGAGQLIWPKLKQAMGAPRRELNLVSAYFVPGRQGREHLAAMAREGVEVRILTNSLEATDVAAVHAGYAKHREALLAAGVSLFEMKRAASGSTARAPALRRGGSSASSLHAKTFQVDGARIFVGSFNFDPRSERLNTEMGFVIDSATLARSIAASFADDLPDRAYRLRLDANGEIEWIERSAGREIVHRVEPGTSFWKRLSVQLLSLLPIEWLL